MTLALRHGDSNGVTNPVIYFAAIRPGPAGDAQGDAGAGFLLDPTSLTYRLVNADGTELQTTTAVNLVTEQLGIGRFAPAFTINDIGVGGIEAAAAPGLTVEWVAVIPFGSGTTTITKTTTFRLIPTTEPLVDAYATISDLRDEGVPSSGIFTDARLRVALERAKKFIDRVTMREFRPTYKNIDVDGRGGPILQLDEPIVAIEAVNFTFTTFSPTDLPVEEGDLRVYNRHIRENLQQPDDREDPRLEFLRVDSSRAGRGFDTPIRFTRSQQNMNLVGLFGYTEYDDSPTGCTPNLISWVNMRLAMRYLRPMFGNVSMGGPSPAGPITMEKTRDQAVQYANPTSGGASSQSTAFSGDPEVDQILASFVRPPDFQAV